MVQILIYFLELYVSLFRFMIDIDDQNLILSWFDHYILPWFKYQDKWSNQILIWSSIPTIISYFVSLFRFIMSFDHQISISLSISKINRNKETETHKNFLFLLTTIIHPFLLFINFHHLVLRVWKYGYPNYTFKCPIFSWKGVYVYVFVCVNLCRFLRNCHRQIS